jgi:lipoprotein-anchoring transpeptidase ErfK/SrfK
MRGRYGVACAAALGIALLASGAARAGNFFDFLGNMISQDDADEYANKTLYPGDVPRSRVVPFKYHRQTVDYDTTEKPGTIIIDPEEHFLYFVLGDGQAIRYGVGVGRTGFGWKGVVRIGNKAEWPTWTPPPEMIARERARGNKLPPFMAGGIDNPLGARAMYLYGAGGDTGFRIHGTDEPWTIGLNVSSGCIRLVNDDVEDLYDHAKVGAKVVIL